MPFSNSFNDLGVGDGQGVGVIFLTRPSGDIFWWPDIPLGVAYLSFENQAPLKHLKLRAPKLKCAESLAALEGTGQKY